MQQPPPLLVFIHIPKTAGTTLTTVLAMNEPGDRTWHLGNVFKGSGGVKQGVRFERLHKDEGRALEGVRTLTGHFPLGIRERLPRDRELRYFTFLREPADRTLSHYFQVRDNAERDRLEGRTRPKQLERGLAPLPADATLDDAVAGGYIWDNLQTRMLSGLAEPFGEVTGEMLEQAKGNLRDEIAFFGLTERFDESLVLAKRRLGLHSVLYTASGRVNTSRPRGGQVPEELARAAERCNRYDIELYRYARELFESAPELERLDFEIELAALRAARADGGAAPEPPPPEGFGDEEAWRMLLEARVGLLRHEREVAELKALTLELLKRAQEGLEQLERRKARQSGRGA
jgi:Sulfotransferase family